MYFHDSSLYILRSWILLEILVHRYSKNWKVSEFCTQKRRLIATKIKLVLCIITLDLVLFSRLSDQQNGHVLIFYAVLIIFTYKSIFQKGNFNEKLIPAYNNIYEYTSWKNIDEFVKQSMAIFTYVSTN